MIHEQSVSVAQQLSQLLANNNYYATAIPGTPLWELSRLVIDTNDGIENVGTWNIVSSSEIQGLDGVQPHAAAKDVIRQVLANAVGDGLNRARNVVMPIVKETHSALIKEINANLITDINPISIVQDALPALFTNPAIVSMVSGYVKEPFIDIPTITSFPDLSNDELVALIKTGVSHVDEDIDAFIAAASPTTISTVYKAAFQADDRFGDLNAMMGDVNNGFCREVIILAFLFARSLLRQAPLPGVSLSENEYKAALTSIMVQTGRNIGRVNVAYERQVSLGIVVTAYPSFNIAYAEAGNTFIKVNAVVYNQWLEQGNCPEVIMGAYLGDRATTVAALNEKKDAYLAAWTKQDRLIQSKARAASYSRTVSALSKSLLNVVHSFDSSETGISPIALEEKVLELLAKVTERDIEDLFLLVRNLVCDTMFAHTDAKLILETMDIIGKDNPTMDIREVSLRATIDYISAWTVRLIAVKKLV